MTLGSSGDAQILDGLDDQDSKRYMHHYNFPSYSVGETKPLPRPRSPGDRARRSCRARPAAGHPPGGGIPYTLRLVSEVVSSNGSTSQASICGSTLALMDAGVPIKAPVAGISCGLVTEGDRFMTMVDIQGLEDFFGDMDFKVGGTHKGITAIQMDLKVHGLTPAIIKEALEKTYKAGCIFWTRSCSRRSLPSRGAVQICAQDAEHQDRCGQDPRGHRQGRLGYPEDSGRVQLQDRY